MGAVNPTIIYLICYRTFVSATMSLQHNNKNYCSGTGYISYYIDFQIIFQIGKFFPPNIRF
jgi:hypothetical protein